LPDGGTKLALACFCRELFGGLTYVELAGTFLSLVLAQIGDTLQAVHTKPVV